MKKTLMTVILGLLFIVSIGFVSACDNRNPTCKDSVTITGIISNNNNNPVANASVNVTCDHNFITICAQNVTVKCGHKTCNKTIYKKCNKTIYTSLQNISNSIGEYTVYFDDKYCVKGDTVTVQATTSSGMTGENSGVVIKEKISKIKCRIANINVPIVPEFGYVAGALTLISALAIFFVVRRK